MSNVYSWIHTLDGAPLFKVRKLCGDGYNLVLGFTLIRKMRGVFLKLERKLTLLHITSRLESSTRYQVGLLTMPMLHLLSTR